MNFEIASRLENIPAWCKSYEFESSMCISSSRHAESVPSRLQEEMRCGKSWLTEGKRIIISSH